MLKKLSLRKLQIESFITNLDIKQSEVLRGGYIPSSIHIICPEETDGCGNTTDQSNECPTAYIVCER